MRDTLKGGKLRKIAKFALGVGVGAAVSEIIGFLLTGGKKND
jgi:hypothetical protein